VYLIQQSWLLELKKKKMNQDLFCYIIAFIVISSAAQPLEVAQPWNCSTGTDLCFLTPPMRLSWHEASAYCFQRSGGLSHSNDFKVTLFRYYLITFSALSK
jgi:hypothetical protein